VKNHIMKNHLQFVARTAVALAVGFAAVTATLFYGAGTALAPEPAKLTQPLANSGSTTSGAAVYVNTGVQTSVVKWGSAWASNSTILPGIPCTTGDLLVGQITTKVIAASGSLRRCV